MTERTNRRKTSIEDECSTSNRLANLLTRTTIREANNHLQMLHARNQELEQLLDSQKEELNRKDFEYKKLSKSHELLEQHCQQLKSLLDDQNRRLRVYEQKEAVFRETLELKPAIESLLDVLNTFEKVDNASIPKSLNTKPLQFVQPSNKANNDATYRSDGV